MIDMKRTYSLVYAIWKRCVCKNNGNQAYKAIDTRIDMKRTYLLVYAITMRFVCKDILEVGTYSGNNND
jgi:hypothetical protein